MSYLNTKPLIYGFEKGMMKDEVELITDFPASIADMLIHNKVDVALVPVATIPLLATHYIISDYCIGTMGEVASVCLFSNVPLQEIDTILLDYQSRTSVGLLKILLKDYWKINPVLIYADEGYENKITGNTAGLVIGDRAFTQRNNNRYIYDLGSAWFTLTGLPFVFAAWVANKILPEKFITDFNNTTSEGLLHLETIIAANPYQSYSLLEYYTKNIDYKFDNEKQKAMALYLDKLSAL